MTSHKNSSGSRQSRARTAKVEPVTALTTQTTLALVGRLRRMADEVEQLQREIAAVEALVSELPADAGTSTRPGSGWRPSPAAQPWLDARSA